MSTSSNFDLSEISKFDQMAANWWNPQGPCKPLHIINPVRLQFIRDRVALKDKTVVDIGCGGGLLSESMAKLGAKVTGIDLSETALDVAKQHAQDKSLQLAYEGISAEDFANLHPQQFDVVSCMELLEHVPNPLSLVLACARLVKPGGQVFISTINRNLQAYLLAILGAEYALKILPKGTHDYAKFIRPAELCAWLRQARLTVERMQGIRYQAFAEKAQLIDALSVNYIVHASCAD